ncbi:MAG: methionyl-tRNA formyltransferase, partial [Synergistales bacterium]|nr:methionyl-tRNA formyltransferase [Synergistales bacterium]
MRLWFLGSGHFAAVCFAEMVSTFSFEGVVTAPPRKAGRGLKPRPTPLEGAARRAGYEPWRTARIGEEQGLLAAMEASRPDAVLVVDFGRRIPGRLLELPRYGCLNVHPSLLPRYRGAAPVQRAIMEGPAETGVTVFRLVEAMDAGPVLGRERVAIGSE